MERKVVLAIFAPALVALVVRITLFILALPIFGIAFIEPSFQYDAEELAGFNMFIWDESWLYWILVLLGTFYVEMKIFNK